MARKNKILIPEARQGLDMLKGQIMKQKGYHVDLYQPDEVKYEVAAEKGIELNRGKNKELKAKDASVIGGEIGGSMVKALIQMAQEQMAKK